MLVNRTRKYQSNLLEILKFIAQDKMSASKNFKNELDELINNLPSFPFKYRKSFYFDTKMIRDMNYKKYTIVYEINLEKNTIDILNIFKKNKPK
jgi:plasmid stabilization system protein ParE